jgi:hypothetical protein
MLASPQDGSRHHAKWAHERIDYYRPTPAEESRGPPSRSWGAKGTSAGCSKGMRLGKGSEHITGKSSRVG